MAVPEGSVNFLDQLLGSFRGDDAQEVANWSEIIAKRANRNCSDLPVAPIKFKISVAEGALASEVDAQTPRATLCLLDAIQDCLDLMPANAKRFYAAMMDAIAADAEKRDADGGGR